MGHGFQPACRKNSSLIHNTRHAAAVAGRARCRWGGGNALFEAERSDSPVIIGLLAGASEAKRETKKLGASERREALVDGRRVVLDAKDELILKCGKATIVMRRNGRIVARGTHVETDSEGVNRVKGGSVQIN